jgi:hypothetical protein
MRWLFLLLVVLNGLYYVWHQQEAPLRAKEVVSLSLYRGSQQDIRLLSETSGPGSAKEPARAVRPEVESSCLYLGGFPRQEQLMPLERRLAGLEVISRIEHFNVGETTGFWLRISPESRHLLDEASLQNLSKEFNELKHKIMPCEGIATVE